MKCNNCGNEIPDKVKYCGYCGQASHVPPQEVEIVEKQSPQAGRRGLHPLFKGMIGALFLILVVGLVFTLYFRRSTEFKPDPTTDNAATQPTSAVSNGETPVSIPETGEMSSGTEDCHSITFIKDVTYPDGTLVGPGDSFVKIWQIRNNGSCRWTEDYYIKYEGGDEMGGLYFHPFWEEDILAGEDVNIAVQLTAPSAPGEYTAYWNLYDTNDKKVPLDGVDAIWTTIIVTLETLPTSIP